MEKKRNIERNCYVPKNYSIWITYKNLKYYVKKKKDRESQDVLDVA